MNTSTTLAAPNLPTECAPALHRRLAAKIAESLRRSAQPREHYLAGACNHADLEQRMCHWDSQQQRAAGLCVGH